MTGRAARASFDGIDATPGMALKVRVRQVQPDTGTVLIDQVVAVPPVEVPD